MIDGYKYPIDPTRNKLARSLMTDQQKKDYKTRHKSRTILLNAISYVEYEKIINRETTKEIFDSLKMTHEGNAQVKETKA